jgi:signal transduction histidine kinase
MKERMEKLGGAFHLSSGPGAGTQVRFRLPVTQSV